MLNFEAMAKQTDIAKLSWEQAYEELNDIVNSLEDDAVSVDLLAARMERAAQLIKFCSGKLRDTEEAVNRIIRELEDPGPANPSADNAEPY